MIDAADCAAAGLALLPLELPPDVSLVVAMGVDGQGAAAGRDRPKAVPPPRDDLEPVLRLVAPDWGAVVEARAVWARGADDEREGEFNR